MHRDWDSLFWERVQIYPERFGDFLTFDQLVMLSGATPRTLKRLEAMRVIEHIWMDGQTMFSIDELHRVRRALRLRYDLGIGWSSLEVVLHLMDRIDALERHRMEVLISLHSAPAWARRDPPPPAHYWRCDEPEVTATGLAQAAPPSDAADLARFALGGELSQELGMIAAWESVGREGRRHDLYRRPQRRQS